DSLGSLFLTVASAQPTLPQPASESVAPGGTIKFSCTMSSGTNISGYYIYWFQQTAGNPPRYLLYYKDESSKHQDTSSNICYLAITGIQAEDDADYYCGTWHNNALHSDMLRQGTETKTFCTLGPLENKPQKPQEMPSQKTEIHTKDADREGTLVEVPCRTGILCSHSTMCKLTRCAVVN
uniref:Ig-like domain-containing protein n=1 Tax=Gopherus evgoodei TaxID=1825980 RepID=A0A8C4WTZ2_9SAUR